MSRIHFIRSFPFLVWIVVGIIGVDQGGRAASSPHEPCITGKGVGPHANRIVYEGRGMEGIDFDFSRAEVEAALGSAEGGSEHYLTWDSSGIQICFCGDRIKDIHFEGQFRGKLNASNLGIGSDLDAVLAAYGDVKEEKVVDSVCSWHLDRVLLVRADPAGTDEPAYKLFYYDEGLFFLFDEDELIIEFGAYPPCSK